jgi:hypothetical protein
VKVTAANALKPERPNAQGEYDHNLTFETPLCGLYLYVSVPGPNFDKNIGLGTDQSSDFTTPIGEGANAQLAPLELDGQALGLSLKATAGIVSGYVAVNPGIQIVGRDGEVEVTATPLIASGNATPHLTVPSEVFARFTEVERASWTGSSLWGAWVDLPVYSAALSIIPTVSVGLGLDILAWDWKTKIGPFPPASLGFNVGRFEFDTHEGTPTSAKHIVTSR